MVLNVKKTIAALVATCSLLSAPAAVAYPYAPLTDLRHPSEIAREQAKSPLQRLQDNILMRVMQASFLGMLIPENIANGNNPAMYEPLAQCVQNSTGSAEIQPVQMVATWGCVLLNPKLNPMPAWYM